MSPRQKQRLIARLRDVHFLIQRYPPRDWKSYVLFYVDGMLEAYPPPLAAYEADRAEMIAIAEHETGLSLTD